MSYIEDLTIKEAKEIFELFDTRHKEPQTNTDIYKSVIGKMCIVRTFSAGVHIGIVSQIDGTTALLTHSRRLWCWSGAFTLSEVAIKGVSAGTRISCEVPSILLTEAVEFLQVTQTSLESFGEFYEKTL